MSTEQQRQILVAHLIKNLGPQAALAAASSAIRTALLRLWEEDQDEAGEFTAIQLITRADLRLKRRKAKRPKPLRVKYGGRGKSQQTQSGATSIDDTDFPIGEDMEVLAESQVGQSWYTALLLYRRMQRAARAKAIDAYENACIGIAIQIPIILMVAKLGDREATNSTLRQFFQTIAAVSKEIDGRLSRLAGSALQSAKYPLVAQPAIKVAIGKLIADAVNADLIKPSDAQQVAQNLFEKLEAIVRPLGESRATKIIERVRFYRSIINTSLLANAVPGSEDQDHLARRTDADIAFQVEIVGDVQASVRLLKEDIETAVGDLLADNAITVLPNQIKSLTRRAAMGISLLAAAKIADEESNTRTSPPS